MVSIRESVGGSLVLAWILTWILAIWSPIYRFEFFLTGCFSLLLAVLIAGMED